MTSWRPLFYLCLIVSIAPFMAHAHASEQGFVLLLPTELYTGAGVVAVALTILVLAVAPNRWVTKTFTPVSLGRIRTAPIQRVTQVLSFLFVLVLVMTGLFGPRDPLSNPLVLVVWTVFWIGLVSWQGLIGNVWGYLSPLHGGLRLARMLGGNWSYISLPRQVGRWPALVAFLMFSLVLLVDPAPSDPNHLARIVAGYLVFQTGAACVFGPRWLAAGEAFGALMGLIGRVAMFGPKDGKVALGVPGWQIANSMKSNPSAATLCVAILAVGSFDGLNETFWWLGQLGMNPLEFSGRSAVVTQNSAGIALALILLMLAFSLTLTLGQLLSRSQLKIGRAFCLLAPSLLPIALGYHVAHYLPSFLVDSQWALVALSDPFMTGADLLGLGQFYVTTGFFNTKATVQVIYLTQATAIVLGHLVAVLVAHRLALQEIKDHRTAVLYQIPMGVFMIAYTLFGLWLLASPRF